MDDHQLAAENVRTGKAWEEFCDSLKAAGQIVLQHAPDTDVDRAEGFRYLTRLLRVGLRFSLEYGDPSAPQIIQWMHETQKFGVDNPDQIYLWARISENYEYRLSGARGNVSFLSINVYGGSFGRGGRRRIAHLNADDIPTGPDGRFELMLSTREHSGNWIRLEPDTTTLVIRQTMNNGPTEFPVPLRGRPGVTWPTWSSPDAATETPIPFTLERLNFAPPPPLTSLRLVKGLQRAVRNLVGTATAFAQLSDRMLQTPNTILPTDEKMWAESFGDPEIRPLGAYWKLAPDEAWVIEFTPPECRYWSFLLCNYWAESLEYRFRPVWTNKHRARYRPDGSVTLVVSHRDPGLPDVTWLDTEGHREGMITLRWVMAKEAPVPTSRVVKLADLLG